MNLLTKTLNDLSSLDGNDLFSSNVMLAVSIALSYNYPGISKLDLVQESLISLLLSSRSFDDTKGYQYSSYAYRCCHNALNSFIKRTARLVKVPELLLEQDVQINKKIAKLEQLLSSKVSTVEILYAVGITQHEFGEYKSRNSPMVSVDDKLYDGSEATYSDYMTDGVTTEHKVLDEEASKLVVGMLDKLNDKQKHVIEKKYFEGMSLVDIAKGLGVSKQTVSQHEQKALKKLRGLL